MAALAWLVGILAVIAGSAIVLWLPSPKGGAPGCLLATVGGFVLLIALGVALMGG